MGLRVARDPYVNADKLPRIPMDISTASGLPGAHDNMGSPRIQGNIVYNFRAAGTHSWGYWEDDLHESWPMIAHSLDI